MGHPFCFGCPKENKDNSRSLRDDNKKGKGNRNSNGKGNRRSFDFAQFDFARMTGFEVGIGMERRPKTADFSAALLTMKL
jgi:hypothetical protein